MTYALVTRPGPEFSSGERETFIRLVLEGGEVPEHTLRAHASGAPCLTFLRQQDRLLGVGALKAPFAAYRAALREKAGIAVDEQTYPFELGYVLVVEGERGNGHSARIVNALLPHGASAAQSTSSRSITSCMRVACRSTRRVIHQRMLTSLFRRN